MARAQQSLVPAAPREPPGGGHTGRDVVSSPAMIIDHVNIRPHDLEAMRDFLVAVLDLTVGDRPPFPFPGYWLYDAQGRPAIHLQPPAEGERGSQPLLNHIAFGPYDHDAKLAVVTAMGWPVRLSRIPARPIRQIFVTGPEGIRVELQCPE